MSFLKCKGFSASAVSAEIKYKDRLDLALLVSDKAASAAAVFTQNKIAAAPVLISREHIKSGYCQALIVNSGNANCATGKEGLKNAGIIISEVAKHLKIEEKAVQIASTGVIGQQLDTEKISLKIPELIENLSPQGLEDLASAIMTTDLVKKTAGRTLKLQDGEVSICGVAKGSGMISPDMATMLSFIVTDADISPEKLNLYLNKAVEKSFNRISVDGDTSTNDMVLIMASGASNLRLKEDEERLFIQTLEDLCLDLAKQIVRDGEGATKLVKIIIKGAKNNEEALKAARSVANSPLVKTAIFGEDANWGRLAMAVGKSEASLDPDNISLAFDDFFLVEEGRWLGSEAERKASEIMKKKEFSLSIDLAVGEGSDFIFTCDFSYDYVRINADYRS